MLRLGGRVLPPERFRVAQFGRRWGVHLQELPLVEWQPVAPENSTEDSAALAAKPEIAGSIVLARREAGMPLVELALLAQAAGAACLVAVHSTEALAAPMDARDRGASLEIAVLLIGAADGAAVMEAVRAGAGLQAQRGTLVLVAPIRPSGQGERPLPSPPAQLRCDALSPECGVQLHSAPH